jgi:alkaline phosphatase D
LRDNPGLVEGTLVGERNFCALEFSGPKNARRFTIRSIATDGRELWRREITAAELGVAAR